MLSASFQYPSSYNPPAEVDRDPIVQNSKYSYKSLPRQKIRTLYSRVLCIHCVTFRRRLQEVGRYMSWNLSLFSPVSHSIKILTLMIRIEIDMWLWSFGVYPNLAHYTNINCAHQLLADDIKTMSYGNCED